VECSTLIALNHEQETIRAFVLGSKRERYLQFVSQRKTRTNLTHALAHFKDIDPKYITRIPPSHQNPDDIARILTAKGAYGIGYLISEHPELDGRELPVSEALNEIVGSGMGTIFSCIPGKLAFMETEDDRFILEREKKAPRPRRCIRFIAPQIDSDSRVNEGIFMAAYRLRDEGDIPTYQRHELRSQIEWFNQNLPHPEPLADPRNAPGVSWFKSDSKECISRVWRLVHILEENGIVIRKITTKDPGYVIYEDEHQIVAWPSGTTFK
jgi:hypothetical protein